jgi:hypothetical protein
LPNHPSDCQKWLIPNRKSKGLKDSDVFKKLKLKKIKECNFWGNDYIISGSDCGHVFFWNKHTGKIVNVIEADKHVVNCVQENPVYPGLLKHQFEANNKKLINSFGLDVIIAFYLSVSE